MRFKKAAGLPRVGHIGGAAGQAAEAGEDAFLYTVTREPVLVAHRWKDTPKTLRKIPLPGCQLLIGQSREGGQVRRGREDLRIRCQEMVIDHIRDGAGVKAIIGSEIRLCAAGSRMGVCKGVDSPVKGDAGPDGGGIIQLVLSLYKIADQISGYDVRDLK